MTNAAIASAVQAVAPGALIELFQLELNVPQHGVAETYYFHAGTSLSNNDDLIWAGQPYMALPIEVEGFEYSGQGTLPRPKMRISNIMGTITALILTLPEGLEGAKFTRIRTLGRFIDSANFPANTDYLLTEDNFALMYEDDSFIIQEISIDYLLTEDDFALLYEDNTVIYQEVANPFGTPDPTAEFPREIYYVDRKSAENRDVVEFELASAFDMAGIRAPKRQCITRCQWVYRSVECGYTGTNFFNSSDVAVGNASQDVCGKRVDSCKARFGQSAELPFGGYPGIGTYFT
jgi:phage-related protein